MSKTMLFEPGIDVGTKQALYYRVRQASPSKFTRFRMGVFGAASKGIKVNYGFNPKTNRMEVQSLLFLKKKWTIPKVRAWLKKYGYRVMGEVTTLAGVPPVARKLFNYKINLIEEWRTLWLIGMAEDKPSASIWAGYQFEKKYKQSPQGRWYKRASS